jgi:uncharacterized protein YggU (UPF0235/DUF167 family)
VSECVSVTLALKVTPRAGADAIDGWRTDARDELLVRVRCVPEAGKANAAVLKTLARALGIPRQTMAIVRGASARHKIVAFEMDERAYRQWRESVPIRH